MLDVGNQNQCNVIKLNKYKKNSVFVEQTSHADGSLKFWDASAVNLQILYKLKTAKLFEKPRLLSSTSQQSTSNNSSNSQNNSNKETETGNNIKLTETEDHFAIEYLTFSAENRVLCIAGASSQVIVFRFNKQEAQSEITVRISFFSSFIRKKFKFYLNFFLPSIPRSFR